MDSSPSCRFLDLSTELRLEIYRHLALDCLADGDPAGPRGLFLSCRKINNELVAEFALKIRPLLLAQAKWNKARQKRPEARYAPLRMKLNHQHFASDAAPGDLTIIIPNVQIWLLNTQAWTGTRHDLKDNPLFKKMLACLRPILRLRWSALSLNLCRISFKPIISFTLTAKVSEAFFRCLARLPEDLECNFDQTDRLILNYGSGKDIVNENHFQTLFHDFQFNWRHSSSPNVMPTPARGWIARVEGGPVDQCGWKLIYDYRDSLGPVNGALWEIAKEGRFWKGKRQFDGDIDQVLAAHHWEHEYDTEGEEVVSSSDDLGGESGSEDDQESD